MTLGVTTADYAIRVRDASRNLIGEVDAYDQFQAVLRFNAVSDWAMQLDAAHPMAPYLATKGNGIIVTRTIRDATTRKVIQASTLLSGPVRRIERKKAGNLLIVSGKDDTMILAARDAWPSGGLPFMAAALLAGGGPLHYYRLNDPAGTTTPADSALSPANASTTGNPTFGGAGLIAGDPATSVTFAAASAQRVIVGGAGFPTGNAPVTFAVLFKQPSNPAATQALLSYGNGVASVNHQSINARVSTTSQILVDVGGATLITVPSVTLATMHLLVLRWDGTTLSVNLDGGAKQTNAPGAQTIGASSALYLGALQGGSLFWSGTAQELGVWTSALSDADVAALWAAASATHAAFDTRSGIASTILQAYMAANAISAINSDRDASGLSNGTDPLAGGTVPGNERFTPLVTKAGDGALQRLALAASPPLGFRVVQVGTALQAQIYVPSDKTAVAKFSDDLGNLADFDYVVEAPDLDSGGNYVVVLGGGTGAGRAAYAAQDATSIASWGRVETVVDARDTTDTPTLAARAADALASAKEKTSFSAKLAPVESQVYGIDFNLGDKVSVTVDNATFTDIIREVQITLDPSGGETVEPAVGSPNAATVQTALANFTRDIQRLQSRVSTLERVQ